MGVAHSDLPQALVTAHAALFEREFAAAMGNEGWTQFTTRTTLSGYDRQTYHWFGTPPEMVDVDHDEVPFDGLAKFSYSIEDKLWKTGLSIQRRALEDDRLGLLSPRIAQLAQVAAYHQGKLVLEQLTSTANGPLAYDGVALFSDSRTIESSGTIDNNITQAAASGTTPTVAEMQSAIANARTAMAAFADDRGRVRNQVPDTILYPAAVEQTLFQALSGASTPGSVNLVVPASQGGVVTLNGYRLYRNPHSDNAAEMFFLRTMGGANTAMPFIFQERLSPTLEAQTSANSDVAIEEDAFRYTVRARYNVGVGEPRDIIRLTFT